jgi:hypothetical protein
LPPSLGENEVFAQPDLAGDLIELAKCQREQNGREARTGSRQMGTSIVTADGQYQHHGGFRLGKFDCQLSI